ncbi:MAG: 30S ribosomal protein S15 [Planctomycetota bacterium]
MSITGERKQELINEYKVHGTDKGSAPVQVSILTERIRNITEHLKTNKKDYASQRGLLTMVGRRTRLLRYLERTDRPAYLGLIKSLGLRK